MSKSQESASSIVFFIYLPQLVESVFLTYSERA